MAQTLSRKYRPQTFGDVVNQEHIKQTLQNELRLQAIAHAYLFSGPRGIGKTTLARIFAKALNCEKRSGKTSEPCGSCAPCKAFVQNGMLDIIEIDAASHTGVDTVRETIIETARLLPSIGRYKVFIIDEVHMLSASAFNALLKIIEEPPAHVVFIFATTESIKIPATIISRCQRFEFKRMSKTDIAERLTKIAKLEKRTIDKEVIGAIARFSDGALRDAESLLGQIVTLDEGVITMEIASLILPASNMEHVRKLAACILGNDAAESIRLLHTLAENGANLDQLAKDMLELFRVSLLKKIDSSISINDDETSAWIDATLTNISVASLEGALEVLMQAIREAEHEWTIPTLPLELCIIRITTKE